MSGYDACLGPDGGPYISPGHFGFGGPGCLNLGNRAPGVQAPCVGSCWGFSGRLDVVFGVECLSWPCVARPLYIGECRQIANMGRRGMCHGQSLSRKQCYVACELPLNWSQMIKPLDDSRRQVPWMFAMHVQKVFTVYSIHWT